MGRQTIRRQLRIRAEDALRGLMGRGLARADRRLVAHAYGHAAYRLGASLPPLARSKYSHWQGAPVTLNQNMVAWVAKVQPDEPPLPPQATGDGQ